MEHFDFVLIVGTATVTAGKFRRGEVDEQEVIRVSTRLREELRKISQEFSDCRFDFHYDREGKGNGRLMCDEDRLILNGDHPEAHFSHKGHSAEASVSIKDHLRLLGDAHLILRYLRPIIDNPPTLHQAHLPAVRG